MEGSKLNFGEGIGEGGGHEGKSQGCLLRDALCGDGGLIASGISEDGLGAFGAFDEADVGVAVFRC